MSVKRVIKFLGRKEVKLFITFLIIYFYFICWYGWNEESNFALTRAIVDENRFEIDSFHNLTGDRSVYQEHYYSDKVPGLSFLAAPTYAGWKFIYYNVLPESFSKAYGTNDSYIITFHHSVVLYTYVNPGLFTLNSMFLVTAFTSSIFTALTALLIYKISKEITKNENYRIAATVAYALGTLAFPYALHFMSHAAGAFFAFFAFYLLFKKKVAKRVSKSFVKMSFLLAGLFVGFAAVIENVVIIIIPMFLAYVMLLNIKRHKKGFVLFFSGLIIGIMPLAIYNYTIFGNPLDFPSAHIDREIYRTAYPETPFNFVFFDSPVKDNIEDYQFVKYSFFSSLSSSFKWLLEHFHFVLYPNLYVFIRLLLYPYRGLLFYSPILLCSFLGLYWMFKKHKLEAVVIILTLLSFLFVVSMRYHWWGGYCFGNRYLTPVVPFLIVPMLYMFDKVGHKLIFILIFSLILLSIFINFLGMQPSENRAYDWRLMMMRSDWSEKQNSFQVFYNPLVEHYWPKFLEKGPRSPLFENIVNGHISIDIRIPALSKGGKFPFSEFYVPFLCIIPLFAFVSLIWGKELKFSLMKTLKRLCV